MGAGFSTGLSTGNVDNPNSIAGSISNILKVNEFNENSVCKDFLLTAAKNRELGMILWIYPAPIGTNLCAFG